MMQTCFAPRFVRRHACAGRTPPLSRLVTLLVATTVLIGADPVPLWAQGAASREAVVAARDELSVERYWHAARLLEPYAAAGALGADGLMLLARARAGFRDWSGAGRLLERDDVRAVGGSEAWYLTGRVHEEAARWIEAAEAYARVGVEGPADAEALVARRARALWRGNARAEALAMLDASVAGDVASWLAHAWLGDVVEAGDTAAVRALLTRITEPEVRDRAWHADARSRWQAGDTSGALEAYRVLVRDEAPVERRALGLEVLGRVALARGDRAEARAAFERALEEAPGSRVAGAAAASLLALDALDDASIALTAARALDRAGDGRGALIAYDRYVVLAEMEGVDVDAAARVERARLMGTLRARQDEAVSEFRALSTHDDAAIGARALELWAGLRRSQGRTNDEATLRSWLIERYPNTTLASNVVFFRGDAAHDRGDLGRALAEYGRVVAMAPALDRAGLSRMRMGQILLREGRLDEALEVYEGYLADFPQGRRWDEASYWAARIRIARGEDPDSPGPSGLLSRLQAEDPFSYYSVLTADLLNRPYEIGALPEGPGAPAPTWLLQGLARLDLYEQAGLTEAAAYQAATLSERAGDGDGLARYALAEQLHLRGRSLDAINLGWALRRDGEPWSLRLVRIVYPFPHRELVLREAEEWGVNPFLLAGLIRQESAWVADIVSSAGAIGLMQVMPQTGRGLAEQLGVEGFTTASLETPEINLHLGARFLVDVLSRYGPELPLALSAYNAGPARADRWQRFPEASDPLHLTERIPFAETRGYVKNVTRNLRLYEALYGPATRLAR